jgi:anaerobic magnesium-protoporphyrin IX monomethyl ester cyclase
MKSHTSVQSSEILLLETPFLSQSGGEEVKAYMQSKYNLALLALGSYVKAHSDLQVSLINMSKDRINEEELIGLLRSSSPKVVGVSLYSYSLATSYRIISRIKQEFPETHVCVGGPHVSIFPQETVQLPNIDSIVLGDGEVPFMEVCRQITSENKLTLETLPLGVYTKEYPGKEGELLSSTFEEMNALPPSDLNLLGDYKRYRDFLSNKVMGILSTSRGCPYICNYCWSEFSRYRDFSVEYMINIMRQYKEAGVEYIEFWDETFNPNDKRIKEFANALLKADLGLTWAIRGAVVNHISYDDMVKLKKTGLKVIQFGVESLNPRLLQYLNKKLDYEKVNNAIKTCHKAGIRTVANMIVNIQGQTREEMHEDFDRLKQLKPTFVSISIYNWAPGTSHYLKALEEKVIPLDFWREHALNPMEEDPIVHPVTEVPIKEVYKMRDNFVRNYYFNPAYIFNYLKLMSPSEFLGTFNVARLMLKGKIKSMIDNFSNSSEASSEATDFPLTRGVFVSSVKPQNPATAPLASSKNHFN